MKIKEVDVENIDPNPWNPNDMPDETFEQLKKEYERVGYLQPILVRPIEDDRYEIVDGEHRWRAARRIGMEQIKVVVKEFTDSEARKTTLNMNDIKGTDNPVELAKVLDELRENESIEQLEQDLVMDREEIKQHEMLLDLPDEEDVADELDEALDEDEEDELNKVEISFEVKSSDAEDLEEEFSCERENLDEKIKQFVLDQTL